MKVRRRLMLLMAMIGIAASTMAFTKVDAYAAKGTTNVYVSTADVSYHKDGCKQLGADKIKVSLNDAVSLGFTQCNLCNAPALDGAKVTTASTPTTATSGDKVWLSATGDKYHKINNCGKMNPNKARQVTLDEAKAAGKTACKKCFK